MADTKYFRIKITVESVAGKCTLGYEPGNQFVTEGTTPAGICLSAFNTLNPAIQTLMFGGSFPWEEDPDVTHLACSDHVNRTVFKVERAGEIVIEE